MINTSFALNSLFNAEAAALCELISCFILANLESISCSLGACPGGGIGAAVGCSGTVAVAGVSSGFSELSSGAVVGAAGMVSSAAGVGETVEGGVISSVSGSLAVSAAVGNAAVTDAGAAATVPSSSFSSPVLVTDDAGLLDSGDSVAIGSAAGPSESGSFSSSLDEGAVGVAAAALTLMLTSVAASLLDSASSSTDPGRLSVVMLSVGLSERFRFWPSLSSLLSGSNSLARFLPLIGVSVLLLPFCPLEASSFLLGVLGLSTGVVSGVSVPPRLGRFPAFPALVVVVVVLLLLLLALACCCCCCCCSFAVGFWRVLILDGESSPVSPPPPPAPAPAGVAGAVDAAVAAAAAAAAAATAAAALSLMALVALESLSHSLMSSSVTELFSSLEMGDGRDDDSVTADDGSGVASFLLLFGGVLLLLLALLLVRVLRRRSDPARRRRCGRLLFAPGVFFHR